MSQFLAAILITAIAVPILSSFVLLVLMIVGIAIEETTGGGGDS